MTPGDIDGQRVTASDQRCFGQVPDGPRSARGRLSEALGCPGMVLRWPIWLLDGWAGCLDALHFAPRRAWINTLRDGEEMRKLEKA